VNPNGREDLIRDLQGLLATRFHSDRTDPDFDLLDSGVVDSVILVELVLELERRFEISLPFEDLEIDDFRTVRRVAELVQRATSAA
jgi:methoxymalonate biosynthesis acyl carrier protein